MPIDSDHPDVARVVPRDLVTQSGATAACVAREPAVAVGSADVLAKSLELDFVIVRFRDPNGRVAAHFARGNACLAFGHWLQDRLAEGERLSRMQVVQARADAQGAESARCEVLPESRLSGRGARSADGRSAQSSCLLSENTNGK
jgi:hypothetical protein